MPILRAAVHSASWAASSASSLEPVMRMARRYTRSPKRSTSRSAASGSSARRAATRLGLAQRPGQARPPSCKHRSEPRAKSFVDVAQLTGQVAHEAAADAIGPSLGLQHAVQEAVDLLQTSALGVREARLQRALHE